MKYLTLDMALAALTVAAVVARGAAAQDAALADPAHCKVVAENAHARVVTFTLAPGEKDSLHTHPAGAYVVTSPGKLKVTPVGGKPEIWEAKPGETAWMEAEGAHVSENVGKTPVSFVLVEVKSAAR